RTPINTCTPLEAHPRRTAGTGRMNNTAATPAPLGKYSNIRLIPVGDVRLAFISGIAAIGEAPFDIRRQSEIIFGHMETLLAKEGGSLADLVKITAFLADIRGE